MAEIVFPTLITILLITSTLICIMRYKTWRVREQMREAVNFPIQGAVAEIVKDRNRWKGGD